MSEEAAFIGDVKYSVLEPGIFIKLNPDWILLAGQTIEVNSSLGKFGITNLPDARGVFLRGVHSGRSDGRGEPAGDGRLPLSSQPDDFRKHNHGGGNHGHDWEGASTIDTWGWNVVVGGNGIGKRRAPDSGGIIQEQGGDETRPQNISLYIYIKVK